MPKRSKIEPAYLEKKQWFDEQETPDAVFKGGDYGVNCVIVAPKFLAYGLYLIILLHFNIFNMSLNIPFNFPSGYIILNRS